MTGQLCHLDTGRRVNQRPDGQHADDSGGSWLGKELSDNGCCKNGHAGNRQRPDDAHRPGNVVMFLIGFKALNQGWNHAKVGDSQEHVDRYTGNGQQAKVIGRQQAR